MWAYYKEIVASLACVFTLAGCMQPASDARSTPTATSLERGRYLVQITGCNDCHTHDYDTNAGKVDEKLWLTGNSLGWQGPWGTTYPPNLRTHMQLLTEDQWLVEARAREMLPPMPWYYFRVMSEEDLRSIYRFIRSLGPGGEPAPANLPPGTEPPLPVIKLVAPPGASA